MPDPLERVRKAALARKRAEAAYRSALQTARDAGHSAAAIAAESGTTRQNVLQLTVNPATTPSVPAVSAGTGARKTAH